jgi:hypothetical protein
MSEVPEAPVTSQRSPAESAAAVQRGILAPVASMASGYASIVGLVLLFSMNRIARLTSPRADVGS